MRLRLGNDISPRCFAFWEVEYDRASLNPVYFLEKFFTCSYSKGCYSYQNQLIHYSVTLQNLQAEDTIPRHQIRSIQGNSWFQLQHKAQCLGEWPPQTCSKYTNIFYLKSASIIMFLRCRDNGLGSSRCTRNHLFCPSFPLCSVTGYLLFHLLPESTEVTKLMKHSPVFWSSYLASLSSLFSLFLSSAIFRASWSSILWKDVRILFWRAEWCAVYRDTSFWTYWCLISESSLPVFLRAFSRSINSFTRIQREFGALVHGKVTTTHLLLPLL